eukprot:5661955-Heterocapsa_arctica.AAC.1
MISARPTNDSRTLCFLVPLTVLRVASPRRPLVFHVQKRIRVSFPQRSLPTTPLAEPAGGGAGGAQAS